MEVAISGIGVDISSGRKPLSEALETSVSQLFEEMGRLIILGQSCLDLQPNQGWSTDMPYLLQRAGIKNSI